MHTTTQRLFYDLLIKYTAVSFRVPDISFTIIVTCNRGDWLQSPANKKGANKHVKIFVGRSMTLQSFALHFAHFAANYCMSKADKL